MTTDSIKIQCSRCGSKLFEHPSDPKPDDMITCSGCGDSARYDAVREAAIEKGKEAITEALRDSLRKAGFK